MYWLHGVSDVGIEVSSSESEENAESWLVPWGSVVSLGGVSRTLLEEQARKLMDLDQQDLLERLREPRPQDMRSSVSLYSLVATARQYVQFNPEDEEVTKALEEFQRSHVYGR